MDDGHMDDEHTKEKYEKLLNEILKIYPRS